MKRWLASGLLLALGASFLVHPVLHALEQDPASCAVERLQDRSPSATASAAPSPEPAAVTESPVFIAPSAVFHAAPSAPVSRGPPPA